jgi:hypothetical protein
MMQRVDDSLRKWSPTHAPEVWIFINSLCCSAAILVIVLATFDKHINQVKESYLIYNFVICFVWFVEVALYIRYSTENNGLRPLWQAWIELLVATYYLVDCATMAYQWHLMEIGKWEIYLDTTLDFVFYVYFLVLAVREHLRHQQQFLGNEDIICDAEASAYVRADEAGISSKENVRASNSLQEIV